MKICKLTHCLNHRLHFKQVFDYSLLNMVLLKQRLTIVIFHITFFFSCPSKANDVWFVTTLNWQPYSGAEMINEGNAVQKLKNKLKENNIESLFEFYP